ncbi:hypothetical protein ACD591_08565 [Rufibacter glacialis]|uniref:Ketohydroxyglutarate aldolase n=1 Tax=Rufibacter glacialis TaxID=1259555 RepID=A0A5M8Q975_9BACT|nr:hypothetical protein [Rufibacter glacialis]KAA6432507.1 hypothetical protein FOE74_15540 [Rufibacter glacialis]
MDQVKIQFIASIDDEHMDQLNEIVQRLEKKGFSIQKVRKITGTISGIVDSMDKIREAKIEGVKIIDTEREYFTQGIF